MSAPTPATTSALTPATMFNDLPKIVRNVYDAQAEDMFLEKATSMLLEHINKSAQTTSAANDDEVNGLLFSDLVIDLLGQADSHFEREEEATAYKDQLIGDFQRIVKNSTMLFKPLIGSILRIFLHDGRANIPPEMIARVAIGSCNQPLGILLIEKASEAGSHDSRQSSWIELARIYKSIGEKDVLKSIYESKIAATDFTKEAIDAEIVGDYDHAVRVYFEGITKHLAIEVRVDEAEQSIWAHGCLECLEHLGDWDKLEANMMSDLNNNPQEVWTEDLQDPYLHYFLTSYIKLADGKHGDGMLEPWSADNPNPLFQFIDDAMKDPDHRQILTTLYQPELAMAAIMRGNFKQASHYVHRSNARYLSTWSNLHPLSEKPPEQNISNLQRTLEIKEFLGCANAALRASSADPLAPLLSEWDSRFPDKSTNNMITWNNVLDDRKLMIQCLVNQLPCLKEQETMISKNRIHGFMNMSAAACEQGNFRVADSCIASMKQLAASSYDIYYSELELDLAKADLEMDHIKKADILVDTISKFEKCSESDFNFDSAQVVEMNVLGIQAYGRLHDLIAGNRAGGSHLKSNEWVRNFLQPKGAGASIFQGLQQRGYERLRSAAATFETGENMSKKFRLTAATYCDRILRHSENRPSDGEENKESSSPSVNDLTVYAEFVVKNTLLSIRDEELGATELFPRLLQIIEIYPSSQNAFTELVSQFPGSWAFVRWIQQMVAVLDKPIGACVMPILKSITWQYPNALYYPLTISAENYTFERDAAGMEREADVALLKKAIRSPLKEDFIFELRRLSNPDHLLKDWLDQTAVLMHSDPSRRNLAKVAALYQDLHYLVLDSGNPRLGAIAQAFAEKYSAGIQRICGVAGQRLRAMFKDEFKKKVFTYCGEILKMEGNKNYPNANLLKTYSPWLDSFQASDHEDTIEIPGQFTGLNPPSGQTATILRFDQKVLAMNSLRKPKRICIIGSDKKEHLFLVKGGEDLRLDQRIQQLFSLMNDIMKKDLQCSQRNLSIGTYKVIPMSGSLGILEWVDNTKPLRHCIEGEITDKESWKKIQEQYYKFVASFKSNPKDSMFTGYRNLLMYEKRDKVVKNMESLYSQFRDDYLRQSIIQLASSAEAFLMLRSQFAKSLAAINVCSYVLGIGDRHLENFLLDMSTGCMIPIDFGHAFGSATEVLPVPEIAPFRLTRQLEAFLHPLGTKGLLEHPMVCIMKALQGKKDIILNTMDVFVKEPLLDWQKYAKKHAKAQTWYPLTKLDIARRKLEAHNPIYLVVEELELGHEGKPFLPNLKNVVLGDQQHCVRARHGKVCTSVQGQVECLIDMATDLDILGRAYVGWMSWV